jgi:hypothetical protein
MSAKDIILKPIPRADADRVVKEHHYSGKVVQNSKISIGVFYAGRLEGALQFGPSLKKSVLVGLVEETPWDGFIELNRMAFSDCLPRNSESRAISIAMRLLRKHAPQLQWVVSFADGTQCGDGTIYRASGFVLTQIKRNDQLAINPRTAEVVQGMSAYTGGYHYEWKTWEKVPGYQLRYIYFLDATARDRLTIPILPFSDIDKHGAGMYRGERRGSVDSDTPDIRSGEGGASPTSRLHTDQATG